MNWKPLMKLSIKSLYLYFLPTEVLYAAIKNLRLKHRPFFREYCIKANLWWCLETIMLCMLPVLSEEIQSVYIKGHKAPGWFIPTAFHLPLVELRNSGFIFFTQTDLRLWYL